MPAAGAAGGPWPLSPLLGDRCGGPLAGLKLFRILVWEGKKRKREGGKKKMKGSAGFSCKFSPGSALCARSPFERGLEGGYSPAPTPRSPPLFQPPCGGELENPKESLENAGSPAPSRAGISF